jgi:hypothetical protein
MSPAVATRPQPIPDPPPALPSHARDELLPHITALLAYVMTTRAPLLGIISGYLADCAKIVGRAAVTILACAPLS